MSTDGWALDSTNPGTRCKFTPMCPMAAKFSGEENVTFLLQNGYAAHRAPRLCLQGTATPPRLPPHTSRHRPGKTRNSAAEFSEISAEFSESAAEFYQTAEENAKFKGKSQKNTGNRVAKHQGTVSINTYDRFYKLNAACECLTTLPNLGCLWQKTAQANL